MGGQVWKHRTVRVEAGRFREDLSYRINVIHPRIPPLARPPRRHPVAGAVVSGGTVRQARRYALRRERASILSDRPQLGPEALFGEAPQPALGVTFTGETLTAHLDDCERYDVEEALALHGWRIGDTADALGISRKNLWEKMKRHGIAEPDR